ncbi:hypothetical protein AAKU55_003056 [Oxalobacteraceae bacterium GrIS 1.11]
MRSLAITVVLTAFAALSAPAYANYTLGTVVNHTTDKIAVASIVDSGKRIKAQELGRNGNVIEIDVPKRGVIHIEEQGLACPGINYSTTIEYSGQKWAFAYEGEGVINITVNADKSITITGSETGGNGTVFPGGC